MADLDVLFPAGKEIQAGGETLIIKPLKFGQLPQASRLLAPVSKQIAAAFKASGEQTLADVAAQLVELMAESGEDVLRALGFFLGKPREWFDALDPDEGIALLYAVIEVNADFFNRRVLPLLVTPAAANPQTGEKSSDSSSQTGTVQPTSATTP